MAMEMEMMATTINNLPTIFQAMEITQIMETMAVSMAIQVVDHKMTTINQHLIHLNSSHNHPDPIISTFHRHKINKIAQTEVEMVISIHKPGIDTKATNHNSVIASNSSSCSRKEKESIITITILPPIYVWNDKDEAWMKRFSCRLCSICLLNSLPYTPQHF